MHIKTASKDRRILVIRKSEWISIGRANGWIKQEAKKKKTKDDDWPKKLKKGRFTAYCKQQGFDGPCKECAKKALESDDASVRGMASFYLNTVKP